MVKSHVHLNIDSTLLERAKLNNINLSKEFEEHLNRLLSISTYDSPIAEADLSDTIKEQEIKVSEHIKKLNDLKIQLEKHKADKDKQLEEQTRWNKW